MISIDVCLTKWYNQSDHKQQTNTLRRGGTDDWPRVVTSVIVFHLGRIMNTDLQSFQVASTTIVVAKKTSIA